MNLRCLRLLELVDICLQDPRGSSMFCDPETGDVPRGGAEENIAGREITKHTAFQRVHLIGDLLSY